MKRSNLFSCFTCFTWWRENKPLSCLKVQVVFLQLQPVAFSWTDGFHCQDLIAINTLCHRSFHLAARSFPATVETNCHECLIVESSLQCLSDTKESYWVSSQWSWALSSVGCHSLEIELLFSLQVVLQSELAAFRRGDKLLPLYPRLHKRRLPRPESANRNVV